MKSNIFLHFITGCFMFLFIGNSNALPLSDDEAIKFAETKGKELIQAFQEDNLAERYAMLDGMIMKHIDIKYISRFVIGKYWREMSEEQKENYVEIFTRYGLALYKTLPLEYAKNILYEIVSANQDKEYTNVLANIKFSAGSEPIEVGVSFRLHKIDGEIKIVDVKIAESSLLLSYRGKFYEMIAQNDGEIDWFLEDLTDKTVTMEKKLNEDIKKQQGVY